jgi:hypothetical protein
VVTNVPPTPNRITPARAAAPLTPEKDTVIRLTQLGIPVKFTLVPDAVCAVLETNGASVPSVSASVKTLLLLVIGASTVIVPAPVALPAKIILDIH